LDLLGLKVELVEYKKKLIFFLFVNWLNFYIFVQITFIIFIYPSLKFYIVNKDDEIVWTIFRKMEIKGKLLW